MKKTSLKVLALGFLVGFSPLPSFAHEMALEVVANELQTGPQLTIEVRSVEEVSGVCPLIVRRFEYVEAVSTLMLDVKKDQPCLIDNFGVVKGSLAWNVPASVLKNGSTRILLNGKLAAAVVSTNGTLAVQPTPAPSL